MTKVQPLVHLFCLWYITPKGETYKMRYDTYLEMHSEFRKKALAGYQCCGFTVTDTTLGGALEQCLNPEKVHMEFQFEPRVTSRSQRMAESLTMLCVLIGMCLAAVVLGINAAGSYYLGIPALILGGLAARFLTFPNPLNPSQGRWLDGTMVFWSPSGRVNAVSASSLDFK